MSLLELLVFLGIVLHHATGDVKVLVSDWEWQCGNGAELDAAEMTWVSSREIPEPVPPGVSVQILPAGCASGGLGPLVTAVRGDPTVAALAAEVRPDMCRAASALASSKILVSWGCLGLDSGVLRAAAPAARSVSTFVAKAVRAAGWKSSVLLSSSRDIATGNPLPVSIDRALRTEGLSIHTHLRVPSNISEEDAKDLLAKIKPPVKVIILAMDVYDLAASRVLKAAEGMSGNQLAFISFRVSSPLPPQGLPNSTAEGLLVVTAMDEGAPSYERFWSGRDDPEATLPDPYPRMATLAMVYAGIGRAQREGLELPQQMDRLPLYFQNLEFKNPLGGVSRTDRAGIVKQRFVLLQYHGTLDPVLEVNATRVWDSELDNWPDNAADKTGLRLPPPDIKCVMEDVECIDDTSPDIIPLIIVVSSAVGGLVIIVGIATFVRKKILYRKMRKKLLFTSADLIISKARPPSPPPLKKEPDPPEEEENPKPDLVPSFLVTEKKPASEEKEKKEELENDFERRDSLSNDPPNTARMKGELVQLKYFNKGTFAFVIKRQAMNQLMINYELRHENLNALLGCLVDPQNPALVWEYCYRGTVPDILAKEDLQLDWDFKLSLLMDLVKGMRYIHNSPLRQHGRLTSKACVIDSRWVLKITDYGLKPFMDAQGISLPPLEPEDLLWTAPEILREEDDLELFQTGTKTGDIYSFAIVMQEIITRGKPYMMPELSAEEIIEKLRHPPPLLRPVIPKQAGPPDAVNLMRLCWSEYADLRPDFNEINEEFKKLQKGKKINIVDHMFNMLEKYSNHLEEMIKERTEELNREKKKTDELLSRMLPASVAEQLKQGLTVEPEKFDLVTIYFSDIVGFTTISAYSEPIEIVDLLNDLYTAFDTTIDRYNVYKVETIGDAYMVVGGLPERIPDHAQEIGTMALELLHVCGSFKIRHLPGIPLMVRIGLHTGPVVAGVVGLTMPRYCLFGDTVNTASRMESTSSAYCIHISGSTQEMLVTSGEYIIEYRGETELKGKGMHSTYWLRGKKGFDKPLPTPLDSSGENHGFKSEEKLIAMGRTRGGGKASPAPSKGGGGTKRQSTLRGQPRSGTTESTATISAIEPTTVEE